MYFEFGQDRLAEVHALKAFELGQRAIEVPLECRFVAQQVIELGVEISPSCDWLTHPPGLPVLDSLSCGLLSLRSFELRRRRN